MIAGSVRAFYRLFGSHRAARYALLSVLPVLGIALVVVSQSREVVPYFGDAAKVAAPTQAKANVSPTVADARADAPAPQAQQYGPTAPLSSPTRVGRHTYEQSWTLASVADTLSVVSRTAGNAAPLANPASPHGLFSAATDLCANCHSNHTAPGKNLLQQTSPQSQLCFACHDGSGALAAVSGDWSDPNVPPNDVSTASFYSHPATVPSTHTGSSPEEFQGVLNRHSECADCHNPHAADTSDGYASANGWTASGALNGVTGVGVTNGPAGSTPSFYQKPVQYEYELCFTCHSSYTNLRVYTTPTYQKKDKAREFNPNNYSYHPVEAAGKNQTAEMAASLAGPSPYKIWNLATTDVVACTQCHASYQSTGNRKPHSSENRAVLRNNYRSRTLKSNSENYDAADFALCYTCHTDRPFLDTSESPRSDTNFYLHGMHANESGMGGGMGGGGSSETDINVPGAGSGPIICAECHWNLHGDTDTNTVPSKRLVEFAPNVEPSSTYDSTGSYGPKWNQTSETGPAAGSCLLACHGEDHKVKNNGTDNYKFDY